MPRQSFLAGCFVVLTSLFGAAQAAAADETLLRVAQKLPQSVAILVHVPEPEKVVDYVMTHPLRDSVEQIPEFKQFKLSGEYSAFRGGVAIFEAALGMKWRKAVGEISGEGLCLAVDPSEDAVAVILVGRNEDTAQKFSNVLLSTLRLGKSKIDEGEYRGVNAFRNDDVAVATVDNWVLATNKPEYGRGILDRILDSPTSGTLAEHARFESFAKSARSGEAAARAFFDVETIRDLGVAPELYSGKTENILAEFLVGGLIGGLATSPAATAQLQLNENSIELQTSIVHADGYPDENRSYFFAPDGEDAAPAPPEVAGRVAALSAYRGLAEAWLRSGDLMIDKATEELPQADSQLSIFFSGKDFGEDILGALDPRVQIVVQRQEFGDAPMPAIQLPGFAFEFKMLDSEATAPEMRRVFISLLGFLNVVGAMEGQPQFDIETSRSDGASVVRASYIAPREDLVPINYNFTPTLITTEDRLIVSSSRTLAESLASGKRSDASEERLNTLLTIDLTAVHVLLQDNLEQLLAQNMLEKGHSREEAETEIGLLLKLVSLLDQLELTVENQTESMAIDTELSFVTPDSPN